MRFDILLMRTDDARYSAVVPALRDWFTFGDSEEEVLKRARGAIYESVEGTSHTPDISLICTRLSPGNR